MTKWVCKEKHSVAAVISSLKLTRRGWLGCESRCGYSMIQCCRSDFVLEVNLSNKAAAVLSLTSRTSAPHLLYSTGRLQGRNHCSSISVLTPLGGSRIMFLQWGNAVDFFYFAFSVNVFYAMFGIIFMKF